MASSIERDQLVQAWLRVRTDLRTLSSLLAFFFFWNQSLVKLPNETSNNNKTKHDRAVLVATSRLRINGEDPARGSVLAHPAPGQWDS